MSNPLKETIKKNPIINFEIDTSYYRPKAPRLVRHFKLDLGD